MQRRIGLSIVALVLLILVVAISTATAQTTTTVFLPLIQKDAIPTPTVTPTTTPLITYTDDFSDPTSGWPNTEDSFSKLDYLNGEYQILVKRSGYYVRAYHNLDASDFQVQVDARAVGDTNVTYGFYFGYDNGNYYAYQVGSGQFRLDRYDSGAMTWTPLVNWTSSSAIAGGNATNHLMVSRSGTAISLYANGSLLTQVSDGVLGEGFVGMAAGSYAANADVRFDNFSLVGVIPVNARLASTEGGAVDHVEPVVKLPENRAN